MDKLYFFGNVRLANFTLLNVWANLIFCPTYANDYYTNLIYFVG